MPFYDYRCNNTKCDWLEEVFEGVNDNEKIHICNNCGSDMRRIISGMIRIGHKNLPLRHNLNATKRRELWKSDDPKDFRQISGGQIVKKH